MNEHKIERVARAICRAAGSEHTLDHRHCLFCDAYPGHPTAEPCIWVSFRREAIAAIQAMTPRPGR